MHHIETYNNTIITNTNKMCSTSSSFIVSDYPQKIVSDRLVLLPADRMVMMTAVATSNGDKPKLLSTRPPSMPIRKESKVAVDTAEQVVQDDDEVGSTTTKIQLPQHEVGQDQDKQTSNEKKQTKRIRIASIVYDEPIPRPPSMPIRKKSYENFEKSSNNNANSVQDADDEGCCESSHDDSFALNDSLVDLWCNNGGGGSRNSLSTSTPSMLLSPISQTKLSFSASWSYPNEMVPRRTTTKKPLVGILKKTNSHYSTTMTTTTA